MNTPPQMVPPVTAPVAVPETVLWSLADLPPAVADDLLLAPTLVDAVAEAVWLLAGQRVYSWVSDSGSLPRVLITPTAEDRYAWARVLPRVWFTLTDDLASTSAGKRLYVRGGRGETAEAISNRRTLEAALGDFTAMSQTLTEAVRGDDSWQVRAALVAAWWDNRLAEGHTPASARTLLALLLNPDDLARCDFLDEPVAGPPAVVRCGRYRLVRGPVARLEP